VTVGLPLPGTVIAGKYLIEGLLGRGGMGVVLAARHQQLDQKVAIKLLLEEARFHPEVVERFSREARAAAKIQGEHVARVIDVGVLEDGAPFMVMEYLDGRDLAEELRVRKELPVGEVVHWILEACEAIAQAHAARIVHRDLKPGNLFLARQAGGQSLVKVLDFGISKSVDPDAPALTKTSSLVGTPYYMAPEQLRAAKSVDVRADIWALGIILYELIAGAPPFDGQSMPEIVAAILTNQPRSLVSARPGVPDALSRVVARCMMTEPGDRFQNIAAVAAALAPFATTPDEARIRRISRVLGVTNPFDEEPSPDTELAPGANPPMISAVAQTMLMPDVSVPSAEPTAPPPAVLVTTHAATTGVSETSSRSEPAAMKSIAGVTASPVVEEPKRSAMKGIVVAAVALAAGAGIFAVMARGSSTPPTNNGIVATATSAPAIPTTPPIEPAPSASAEPTPKAAGIESAKAPAIVASTKLPDVRPTTTTKSNAVPSASASTPRTTPPPAVPSAAASSSRNPLDMGIK
jgi:serine/threonine protein kinase